MTNAQNDNLAEFRAFPKIGRLVRGMSRWLHQPRPSCCGVVPLLYGGPFDQGKIDETLANLARNGSVAAPGFMDPEGIVVFHAATNTLFKRTIKNDDVPKELAA